MPALATIAALAAEAPALRTLRRRLARRAASLDRSFCTATERRPEKAMSAPRYREEMAKTSMPMRFAFLMLQVRATFLLSLKRKLVLSCHSDVKIAILPFLVDTVIPLP